MTKHSEDALRTLRPSLGTLDRDALLYRTGAASVGRVWPWKLLFSLSLIANLAAVVWFMLPTPSTLPTESNPSKPDPVLTVPEIPTDDSGEVDRMVVISGSVIDREYDPQQLKLPPNFTPRAAEPIWSVQSVRTANFKALGL